MGSGPAGLECAHVLARRGYHVTVAEAREEFGGRVVREAGLPNLSEWIRVADYRLYAMRQMGNVDLYSSSGLSADEILEFGLQHIVLATGATWCRNGIGRFNFEPIPGLDGPNVLTPDDLFQGAEVVDPVVIYDEDGAYLANLFAEKLHAEGHKVTCL